MVGKMALVRETHRQSYLADGQVFFKQERLSAFYPSLDHVLVH